MSMSMSTADAVAQLSSIADKHGLHESKSCLFAFEKECWHCYRECKWERDSPT